jgi:hypothetical protein
MLCYFLGYQNNDPCQVRLKCYPEPNMENENFCNGCCWECEKFAEEDSEITKKQQEKEERRKEHEDAGKLDELIKELKEKEGKEQHQRKKPRK